MSKHGVEVRNRDGLDRDDLTVSKVVRTIVPTDKDLAEQRNVGVFVVSAAEFGQRRGDSELFAQFASRRRLIGFSCVNDTSRAEVPTTGPDVFVGGSLMDHDLIL